MSPLKFCLSQQYESFLSALLVSSKIAVLSSWKAAFRHIRKYMVMFAYEFDNKETSDSAHSAVRSEQPAAAVPLPWGRF